MSVPCEAFARAVLDHTTEAILHVDAEGRLRGINRAAAAMFGYDEAHVLGRPVEMLLAPPAERRHADGPAAAGALRAQLGLRRDGRRFPMEYSVTPFELDGRMHATWIVQDVTERVHFEERLQQSQRMDAMGRLAGGVAHDFNNVLTVIHGWCEALASASAAERRDAVAQIAGAATHAATLTNQLLAFSRKATPSAAVSDLNAIVADVTGMLGRALGEDIRIETDLAATSVPVRIDPHQFSQVLVNLALNARDAMPRGGRLRFATSHLAAAEAPAGLPAGPYVRLAVTDTGCGIPDDVLPRIFEPFFTTKAPGRGTGLGLAAAHGIVEQAGGAIRVESAAGSGTTFAILLPASQAALTAPASAAKAGPERGTESVLVIEDDAQVRRIIVGMLTARGYQVVTAADEHEALRAADGAARLDLVVSDVVLPQATGPDVAARVRAMHPEARVLFVSGHAADAIERHGAEPGASFLQKPFSGPQLARTVRAVLDHPPAPAMSATACPPRPSPVLATESTARP